MASDRGDHKRRREMENKELGGLATTLTSLIDVEKEPTSIIKSYEKVIYMRCQDW